MPDVPNDEATLCPKYGEYFPAPSDRTTGKPIFSRVIQWLVIGIGTLIAICLVINGLVEMLGQDEP